MTFPSRAFGEEGMFELNELENLMKEAGLCGLLKFFYIPGE